MRTVFQQYCAQNLSDYEIFLPEAAMGSIFSDDLLAPFDLADFEELVAAMSHAIVLFPEAPGSYAETGYFAAVPSLAQKCILVMDFNRQHQDSFISLGPAKKISEKSTFNPNINLNYTEPDFDLIVQRIRKRRQHKTKKSLSLEKFSTLSPYEIAAISHFIVQLLRIATITDIQYIFRAIFHNHFSEDKVQKVLSILVGATYLNNVGDYGHYSVNSSKPSLAIVKEGFKTVESQLRLDLANIYIGRDPDFLKLIEETSNVN